MSETFDPYAELLRLAEALEAAGLAYALCGGLALAVYGAPRATKDIDLLVAAENVDAIRTVARGLGFRFVALPIRFSSGITVHRITKLVGVHPMMLDLLVLPDGLTEIYDNRVPMTTPEGARLQVVSRDGLITLKTTAGRPQDLVDLQRLLEREGG